MTDRPVQLEVLARPVEQVEKTVDYLVLAHTLVTHQQQVLAQHEVLQHVLHDYQVLQDTTLH